MERAGFDAIVPAGGSARRLGGFDKPLVLVGGITLLDRVLDACAAAERTVVVGPRRPTARPVDWRTEDPPGGGPAAALAAGLAVGAQPWVGVFAADLPFLDASVVHRLWTAAADAGTQGAMIIDERGREQWLAAVYRRAALETAIGAQAVRAEGPSRDKQSPRNEQPPRNERPPRDQHSPGSLSGLPLRRLVGSLDLVRVDAPPHAALDCDTWDDVRAARDIADGRQSRHGGR